MIGIVAKTIDHRVIEEFFQLFKTPWELVQQGRKYDVVIAASEDIPDVDTRLLIVFRSQGTNIDSHYGITPGPRVRGGNST